MKIDIEDKPKGTEDCKEDVEASKDVARKPVARNHHRHGAVVGLGEAVGGVVVAREERHVVATLLQCQSNVHHQSFRTSNPQVWVKDPNPQGFLCFFPCHPPPPKKQGKKNATHVQSLTEKEKGKTRLFVL